MSLSFMISALAVCAIFAEVAFAQDDNFVSSLLSNLDSIGLTSFTDIVRQVQADASETTFFSSISDSSTPVTLFVPDNDAFTNPDANDFGYSYQDNNTEFLSSLLLYHLLPGTYTEDNLGADDNHTVASTSLQGRGLSFLESNRSQSMVLAHTEDGIEVYNQYSSTAVQKVTYTFDNIQIYVLDSVLGIPGPFTFGVNFLELSQFLKFLSSTGVPDLDNQHGLTVFAPSDDAFNAIQSQMSSLSPSSIFSNHVIFGRTIYSSDFQSDHYSASSGCYFTFDPADDQGYTITLNYVTVKIIRSDFLVNNGVIHIVDGVFWNTTQEDVALPPSSTSSAAPWATSTSSGSVSVTVSSPPSTRLSLGTIVGIVAIVVFALSMPLIAYLVWKYRRAMQGTRVRQGGRLSIFDVPSSALRTNPFPINASMTGSNADSEANIAMSDVRFARNSDSGTTSTTSLVSRSLPKHTREKRSLTNASYSPISVTTSSGSTNSPIELVQTSYVRSGHPVRQPPPVPAIPMTPELVDHLWHEFAQRIDRGPRKSVAPPKYLSGYPPR